jgi:hypothetical protein
MTTFSLSPGTSLLVFFLLITQWAVAQNQTEPPSKTSRARQGRELMMEWVAEGRYAAANRELSKVDSVLQHSSIQAITAFERYLIQVLDQDWNSAFNTMVAWDSLKTAAREGIEISRSDGLDKALNQAFFKEVETLKSQVMLTIQDPEKKAFFLLLLEDLANPDPSPQIQQAINQRATDFILQFPKSPLVDFVRKYVRFQMKESNWGFGLDFFLGFGQGSQDLGAYFNNHFTLGHGFEAQYRRIAFFGRNYLGFGTTRKASTIDGKRWEKGKPYAVFLPELSAGYYLLHHKNFRLCAFGGIASLDLGPTMAEIQKNEELETFQKEFTMATIWGFHVDVPIAKASNMVSRRERSYWFLRIRYSLADPRFEKFYMNGKGTMQTFTLSLGGIGWPVRREL